MDYLRDYLSMYTSKKDGVCLWMKLDQTLEWMMAHLGLDLDNKKYIKNNFPQISLLAGTKYYLN